MRNILIGIIFAILVIPFMEIEAQVPIYGLAETYEVNLPSDTIRSYQVLDLNGDSLSDVIYSTLDDIRAFNGINGNSLLDSISFPRGFVFCPCLNSSDSQLYIYSAYKDGLQDTEFIFVVVNFPFSAPLERDTIRVIAYGGYPYFMGLTKIIPFDFGNDGIDELMLFWNYEYTPDGSRYFDFGYYIAFDILGNIIFNTTRFEQLINASSFYLNDSLYLSTLTSSSSYYGGPNPPRVQEIYRTFDDSLKLVDYDTLIPSHIGFKQLKDQNNNFLAVMTKESALAKIYDNAYLNNPASHGMPGEVVISFFRFRNQQLILTGLQSNYYELRDMNMNLLAFIWGPNGSFLDADPIDIDRDGTDELLCQGINRFVLYRLDTTGTAVNEDIKPLPNKLAISAYPNPFNSEVKLSLSGAEGIPVSIGIYDISGRLVRSLLAISGEIVWDGRSDRGEAVSSGVYLIRLAVGAKTITTKVVLLR